MRRFIQTDSLAGLAGLTAAAFLVLAPIYRFPAVPEQIIGLIKLTLFFGAIALSSVVLWKRRDLAGVLKIVASFATFLVAASIVGLVQSDISGISRHLQTIALPALGLLIGFAVWQYFAAKGLRYYAIAMTAVAAVAWLCSALWYQDVAGLAYLRTGWSGSLGYAAIITLAMMGISPSVRTVALWAGCYFIIGASQVYYGGRAGLFFPIFAYLIVLMFGRLGPRIRNATLTITLFASILLTPYAFTLIGTALDKAAYVAQNVSLVPAPAFAGTPQLANTSPILESLRQKFRIARHSDERYINLYDRLMGGRLALMYEAVDLIKQRPLTGWGFTDHRKTGLWKSDSIVHNEWLKAWYQGGPLYLAGVSLVFLSLAFFAWRADGLSAVTGFPPIFTVIVLCQFFTSMVEPNSIIGVFYKSSPFWVLMGSATWIAIRHERGNLVYNHVPSSTSG